MNILKQTIRIRSWKHLCKLPRNKIIYNDYTNEVLSVDNAISSVIYVASDCDEFIESNEYTNREIYNTLSKEHKFWQ